MKIIILRTNLKEGLSSVEKGIIESNALPILKNVLVKTFNNRIKISATNLELGISRIVSGKIIEEGGITVPFHALYGIINNSDSERIHLEVDDNTLLIKTDNYEAKIQGASHEEYPIIPKIDNSEYHLELTGEILKKALYKVLPCCHVSEIRPEISGILIDFQMSLFKLAATDSFRLAEKTVFANQFFTNFTKGFKAIIPLKTVQEFIRIFPDDEKVKVYADASQIFFQTENLEMISRLIDGSYPDYEQIIPKNIDTEIHLSQEQFMNSVKLVSTLSGKVNDVTVQAGENNKAVKVYSANQHLGENTYLIPAKMNGKALEEVHFNWRFLLDGLRVLETDTIYFGVNGESKPALLKKSDDASYFYILMPIKV